MDNSPENILAKMQGSTDPQALLRLAEQTLSDERRKTMQSLLGDPQALERVMQSEQAQSLLRQLQR